MNYLMGKKSLLPLGFRFHPTDVELVMHSKVENNGEAIAEVDIYKFAPWDLPDRPSLRSCDLKWYLFCPVEKKQYSNGARMNRSTEVGYWKITGKDRPVHHNKELVVLIKTLIFHSGKAPQGERTNWVMHEYRLEDKNMAKKGVIQNTQGAPFKEEDWNDDNEVNCVEAGPSLCFSRPTCVLPSDCNSSAITCNLFWIAFFPSHVCLKLWHLTARVFQQFPLMTWF